MTRATRLNSRTGAKDVDAARIDLQLAPTKMSVLTAALAARATTPVNIWTLGDSITEGQGASALSRRWANILADAIRQAYPTAGAPGKSTTYTPVFYIASGLGTPTTVANAPAQVLNMGPGGRAYDMTATNQYIQWAGISGSSFDLVYAKKNSGGALILSVDGTDVATFGGPSGFGYDVDGFRYSQTLAAGTHTIKVRPADTSGVRVDGLMVYNGDETKGIRVIDQAHWGWQASHFTGTMGNALQAQAELYAPSLVTIALGTNDYNANTDPATFQTNMNTIIAKIRAASTLDPSVLLISYPIRGYVTGRTYTWQQYVANAAAIAQNDVKIAHLDLSQGLIPGADSDASYYADAVHPNDTKGHPRYGEVISSWVLRSLAAAAA